MRAVLLLLLKKRCLLLITKYPSSLLFLSKAIASSLLPLQSRGFRNGLLVNPPFLEEGNSSMETGISREIDDKSHALILINSMVVAAL